MVESKEAIEGGIEAGPARLGTTRIRTGWLRLVGLASAVALTAGCTPGDRPEVLALATAGTGGVYYLLGGSIAELWSRELPEHTAVAEVTGGSVENLGLLLGDEVQVAFSMGTNALRVQRGEGAFSGRGEGQLRTIAVLYPNVLHLVTLEGSGIAGPADLRGRRVSVGAPGSGTEVGARTVIEAAGLTYDDLSPQRLNFNETANALRDGMVDAGFWSVGPPTSSLVELGTARSLHLVPIVGSVAEQAIAQDPTLLRDRIPAGSYPGQTEDVPTLSTPNLLVVRADMPDALAGDLLRALIEGRDALASVHPSAQSFSIEYMLEASPIPLHPGVIQYLEASGHTVPDRLRPVP